MKVGPIKPKVIPPGTTRWKLKTDTLLSNPAFKSNLRRYAEASLRNAFVDHGMAVQVDPIKPTLKPPGTKRFKL